MFYHICDVSGHIIAEQYTSHTIHILYISIYAIYENETFHTMLSDTCHIYFSYMCNLCFVYMLHIYHISVIQLTYVKCFNFIYYIYADICELCSSYINSAIHVTTHIYGRVYAIFVCHIYVCSVWIWPS